ncbi:unnamed protein product, partial [Mesorhabditis spiculigera]
MKYLENSNLQLIADKIREHSNDCELDFKIESYSCKMIQSDKRLWKRTNIDERQPLSPPEDWNILQAPMPIGHSHRMRHLSEHSASGGSDHDMEEGCLVDSISKRTLFDLIGVLNTAYGDYDFNDLNSNCFSRIDNAEGVVAPVDHKLAAAVEHYAQLRNDLWQAVAEEIKPMECRIYSATRHDFDAFLSVTAARCRVLFGFSRETGLTHSVPKICRALYWSTRNPSFAVNENAVEN